LGRSKRRVLPVLVVVLALGAAGCGEEGAEEGAELTVYVSTPLSGAEAEQGKRLCAEAQAEARGVKTAGDHALRVVCLDASGEGGVWTLAKVGGNARRATEDSTTVAYVGEPAKGARKQSLPIVEAAEIAMLESDSGKEAMETIISALDEGESDDPRRAVFDAVEG
jgi:branched-chain amino acid transport system substrate-binding protein